MVAFKRAFVFFLLWWALAEGEGLLFGLLFAVPATIASLRLSPAAPQRWRVAGFMRFLWFFLRKSVQGGIDVARRALHPTLALAPTILDFHLRLPEGSSRTLMLGVVSLLPGTLSVDLDGPLLRVHALDEDLPVVTDLEALERFIADLYAVRLE